MGDLPSHGQHAMGKIVVQFSPEQFREPRIIANFGANTK